MLPYTLILLRYTKKEIYTSVMMFTLAYGLICLATIYNNNIALIFARIYNDSGEFEIRNGIIRVTLPGDSFVVFSYIYTLYKLLLGKITKFEVLVFAMSIVAIWVMQTRQIFVAIGLISIYICLKDKRGRKLGFIILAIISFYIFSNFTELFGDFIETTNEELGNDDYNRWKSYRFFISEITRNIITFFTGFGQDASQTYYNKVVENWWTNYGIAPQDVGFIGTCFYFGIIYIYFYFKMVYNIGWKKRKSISPEISSFILCTFIYSIFIFPFSESGLRASLWSCLFYILIIENNRVNVIKHKRRL